MARLRLPAAAPRGRRAAARSQRLERRVTMARRPRRSSMTSDTPPPPIPFVAPLRPPRRRSRTDHGKRCDRTRSGRAPFTVLTKESYTVPMTTTTTSQMKGIFSTWMLTSLGRPGPRSSTPPSTYGRNPASAPRRLAAGSRRTTRMPTPSSVSLGRAPQGLQDAVAWLPGRRAGTPPPGRLVRQRDRPAAVSRSTIIETTAPGGHGFPPLSL